MVSLNEKRLTATGINQAVNEIQETAQRNALKAGKSVEVLVSEKLDAEKDVLKRIYFPNMNTQQIQGEIQSARFAEFPQLKYVLGCIFAQEKHPGVIAIPESLPDWTPPHTYTKKSLQDLISKYRYFDITSEAMEFFETLQPLCRKMTQLVERQADDDEMAYKLMVLFPQRDEFSDHTGCLKAISEKFNGISKKVQAQKPYHRAFVTELGNFPSFETQEKIDAWREFIVREKFDALAFFADCNSFTSIPKNLKEAKTAQLAKRYSRAEEDIEFAAFCKSLLIDNDGFESGLEFIRAGWPTKIVDNLPDVGVIKHDVDNYEYRWVKLPQREKHALYLGKMTGCCQFINGDSRQCVIDGISLSDNGFYVLLKKKITQQPATEPKKDGANVLDGEIVAQSYAWISTNGNLCLDSLEWNQERVSEEILETLMSKFADKVFQKYPLVKYVNVGTGGHTPEQFGPIALLSETQRQGTTYGDAAVQFCIKSKLNPEVTSWLSESPEFNGLDETLQKKIRYLSPYLESKDLRPVTITSMSNLLKTCLFQPFPAIFEKLTTSDFQRLAFEDYQKLPLNVQKKVTAFRKLLNCENFERLLQWLPTFLPQEYLNILVSRNQLGQTILHTAAQQPKFLETILQCLQPKDLLAAVQTKDSNGNTVLQLATSNPNSLEIILEQITEEDRLAAVQTKDSNGNTVLQLVASNPESLKMILGRITAEECLTAVQDKDSSGYTLLQLVKSNPNSLKIILEQITEEDRLAAVQVKDSYEQTVLHLVASIPESLRIILDQIPAELCLAAVQDKDSDEQTVLHRAASIPESLTMILQSLLPKDRLSAVQDKDRDEKTVLHLAASIPESLKMILGLLPKKDLLAALQTKDSSGNTVLHLAASIPESLRIILDQIPAELCLAAVQDKDSDEQTVLHRAASIPESLRIILDHLPGKVCLADVQKQDRHGRTVLHQAASNPESLTMILELIPAEEYLAAVQVKDNYKQTILHRAANNPDSLTIILQLLPEQARLDAVKEADEDEETVLHAATINIESLKIILKQIPEKDLLAAVQVKNTNEQTVLHLVANDPDSLKKILVRITAEECLSAVQDKDSSGNTVLHRAANNPDSLKTILELLPEKARLEAVKAADNEGKTVLHAADAWNTESLKAILKCLSPEDRLEAFKAVNSKVKTEQDVLEQFPESFLATLGYNKNDSPSPVSPSSMFKPPTDPKNDATVVNPQNETMKKK